MSAEDVVRQLKLAPRQLKAIETGDWEALPGPAFTRAVLRSYGRVLGVDIEPLVTSVSPVSPTPDLKPAATLDEPLPSRSMFGFGSGGGGSRLAWTLLVVLGVIAVALFFGGRTNLSEVRSWLSELRAGAQGDAAPKADAPGPRAPAGGASVETVPLTLKDAAPATEGARPAARGADGSTASGSASSPDPAVSAASAPASTGPAASGSAAATAGAGNGTAASSAAAPAPAPSAPVASTARTPAPDGAAPAPAAASPGGRSVTLRFERESWVEAKSADGTVLFTGTNRAQTSREFAATGPVSLVIGNAEFVRAEVDGRSFDLVPHTRASIARVTIR